MFVYDYVVCFFFQFFCSMSATFTLNFFLSGLQSNSWGYFYMPGLINFGVFKVRYNCMSYFRVKSGNFGHQVNLDSVLVCS